jgi:hypothetical protein
MPWLLAMQRDPGPGDGPLAAGYGYALGLLAVVASIHLAGLANMRIGFLPALVLPAVVGVIGWWRALPRVVPRIRFGIAGARASWREMGRTTQVVCVAMLVLLAVRMLTLGFESLSRPIFPWEAVSVVASKARIWYETGTLARFVSPVAVLEGLGTYTDAEPSALSLPSLLLVWTANAIGQWQEGAVAFAWWGLGVAIGLAAYGHLRRSGTGVAYSLVFTYVLLSLPLVDTHILLAGAPQWIAAAGVGLSSLAFMRWIVAPSGELLLCVLIGAALALFSLASTWPWFAIFAVAAAIQRWPRVATKLAVGVPLIVALALLALMQTPLKLGGMAIRFTLAAEWNEAPESLILLGNWHLLFGLLLFAVVAGWREIFAPEWRARTWAVAMGLGLMVVKGTLALIPYWFGGLRDFSYAALQLAPMLVMWIALIAHRLATERTQAAAAGSVSPP